MDLNRLSRVFSTKEKQKQQTNPDKILEEELKCPICLEVSRKPITTDCCGSVFCEGCIKNIKTNKCPKCNKQSFTYSQNIFANRLVNQFPIICRYGCGHVSGGSEIGNHEKQCPNKILKCKYCNFEGIYNSFLQHIINQHVNQIVQLFEKQE
ncbi:hypothetical protein ABPG74_008671 [Tetrahymena malaccensis]